MKILRYIKLALCLTAVILVVAACGGEAQTKATPTTPPTQTPFPTFVYIEPTKPAIFEQGEKPVTAQAESTEESEDAAIVLDPKMVSRGLGRYEALACASCHGAGGEGTEKAVALLDFAMNEDDFITFMRSGGDLGPDHQYSTDRLSNSGSRNLYQYLLSLAQGA